MKLIISGSVSNSAIHIVKTYATYSDLCWRNVTRRMEGKIRQSREGFFLTPYSIRYVVNKLNINDDDRTMHYQMAI